MAAINATLTFTPALPNGALPVSGANFTDLKNNALTAIAARRTQPAADVVACDAATAAVNA